MRSEAAYPSYRRLLASGELQARAEAAFARLDSCDLCPRNCRVSRLGGEVGYCRSGLLARVASMGPHFGEEAPLVGRSGSGAIFLTGCSLGCVFCQNCEISHNLDGREVSIEELARMMLDLEAIGCHNINLVTPTHFVAQILEAVGVASQEGLGLPLVYNCGGYEAVETLSLLEGVIDIYMPDFKFWEAASSERYCNAPDYPARARQALLEMYRQVGDLVIQDGLARRGLLVRHLVMPGGANEAERILEFIAREISPETFVNVMAQYKPCHRAAEFPEIARPPGRDQVSQTVETARKLGLKRVYT